MEPTVVVDTHVVNAVNNDDNNNNNNSIDSKELIRQLLGSRITCRLTNGHTVKGRLVCLDRLMNIILADCTCEHTIWSSHYTQETNPPVQAKSIRRLLQAMVPGPLVASVHVDEAAAFDQAVQRCCRSSGRTQQQPERVTSPPKQLPPPSPGAGGAGQCSDHPVEYPP